MNKKLVLELAKKNRYVPLRDPETLKKKLATQMKTKALGLHKKQYFSKKRRRKISKCRETNHPMHNPLTVKKKVETFARNFNEETRQHYRDAIKKRWEDPEFRKRIVKFRAIFFNKFIEDPKNRERLRNTAMRGTLISCIVLNPRTRSKTSEKAVERIVNHRKINKHGKEKWLRRRILSRKNDYNGVVMGVVREKL